MVGEWWDGFRVGMSVVFVFGGCCALYMVARMLRRPDPPGYRGGPVPPGKIVPPQGGTGAIVYHHFTPARKPGCPVEGLNGE